MIKEYYHKYFGKKVKVETTGGKIFIGIFYTIDRPEDTGYNEWSISILVKEGSLIELLESKIKSMERFFVK